jgi:hypothetical protein
LEKTTTSFCAMVESTSSLAELIAAGEEEENEAPSLNDVLKATEVVLCANWTLVELMTRGDSLRNAAI